MPQIVCLCTIMNEKKRFMLLLVDEFIYRGKPYYSVSISIYHNKKHATTQTIKPSKTVTFLICCTTNRRNEPSKCILACHQISSLQSYFHQGVSIKIKHHLLILPITQNRTAKVLFFRKLNLISNTHTANHNISEETQKNKRKWALCRINREFFFSREEDLRN